MANREFVATAIGNEAYARARLQPAPGDTYFLHLKDLRTALDLIATTEPIWLLDFGCGSSPYRSLFPNAEYRRADYVPSAELDYVIGEDQLVTAPNASFDLVLSTQVLEHVRDVEVYLGECFRLLRPGGRLVLTTHGLFEEHGCPYDFRRWTADGLRHELERAGFKITELKKLTTAQRAVGFFLHLYAHLFMGHRRREPLAFLHWLLFRTNGAVMAAFDRWCDRRSRECSVVELGKAGHELYIALFVVAERPAA